MLTFLLFLLYVYLLIQCVCECGLMGGMACMGKLEDSLLELFLSFFLHIVQTQFIRLGSKGLT